MEKKLKEVSVLATEKLSVKEIEDLVKILICSLITNSIVIIRNKDKKRYKINDDIEYCCIYFKIQGHSQQKELALVFNKIKYSVTTGVFVFEREETEVGLKEETVKILPLIPPEVIAVFNFESLKIFSDHFFKISQYLH
jgi:hypothetical protein